MLGFWRRWFYNYVSKQQPSPSIKWKMVEALPDHCNPHTVYIVRNNGYSWQLNLKCPCGCGTLLYINLLEERKPCWRYTINAKKQITILPSLHRRV